MRPLLFAMLTGLAAAPAWSVEAPTAPVAGKYVNDPSHTSVTWRVMHLGLSNYTARFAKVASTLQLDPAKLAASSVSVTIAANSVRTDYPFPDKTDFDKEIGGDERFLDGDKFPEIKFVSTKIVVTGAKTAKVTGNLTLRGVTRPVTLDARFNGATPANRVMGAPRAGFSATAAINRSDFGMSFGTQFVGDRVELAIEAEYVLAQ